MTRFLLPASLALLAACTPVAHAGDSALFGAHDTVRFVADTTLQAPAGRLYLGHLVRTHAFLLPYRIESQGLVFGVAGDPDKVIPMPPLEELASLQSAGLLPRDLPRPELGPADYLLGYSLQGVVIALVVIALVARRMRARRPRRA